MLHLHPQLTGAVSAPNASLQNGNDISLHGAWDHADAANFGRGGMILYSGRRPSPGKSMSIMHYHHSIVRGCSVEVSYPFTACGPLYLPRSPAGAKKENKWKEFSYTLDLSTRSEFHRYILTKRPMIVCASRDTFRYRNSRSLVHAR
jgi:hypothetical protein